MMVTKIARGKSMAQPVAPDIRLHSQNLPYLKSLGAMVPHSLLVGCFPGEPENRFFGRKVHHCKDNAKNGNVSLGGFQDFNTNSS